MSRLRQRLNEPYRGAVLFGVWVTGFVLMAMLGFSGRLVPLMFSLIAMVVYLVLLLIKVGISVIFVVACFAAIWFLSGLTLAMGRRMKTRGLTDGHIDLVERPTGSEDA